MSDAELEAIRARDAIWSARYGRKTDPACDRRILLDRLDAAEARLAEMRATGDSLVNAITLWRSHDEADFPLAEWRAFTKLLRRR